MTDWADEKAKEWLDGMLFRNDVYLIEKESVIRDSLAALLREVVRDKQYEQWNEDQHVIALELKRQLAEVRRVVEDARGDWIKECEAFGKACDEILSRLEKL